MPIAQAREALRFQMFSSMAGVSTPRYFLMEKGCSVRRGDFCLRIRDRGNRDRDPRRCASRAKRHARFGGLSCNNEIEIPYGLFRREQLRR
jgi:hypothetical protein